jgi:hypothetical protein
MARIRTVKPELFKHSVLFDAEQETKLPLRLAYIGLWTCCDREGRFKWRPRELQLDVLPFDKCDFSRVLDALAARGFIVMYQASGETYGFIPSWKRNQFINNREASSVIPEPQQNEVFDASGTRDPRENDASGTDVVKEGKGKEGKGASLTREDLPEWIPSEPWNGWLDVRKKKHSPVQGRSRTIAINKLKKWKDQGYDLTEILDAATFGNWQGLYLPEGIKPKKSFRSGDPNNPADWAAATLELVP